MSFEDLWIVFRNLIIMVDARDEIPNISSFTWLVWILLWCVIFDRPESITTLTPFSFTVPLSLVPFGLTYDEIQFRDPTGRRPAAAATAATYSRTTASQQWVFMMAPTRPIAIATDDVARGVSPMSGGSWIVWHTPDVVFDCFGGEVK